MKSIEKRVDQLEIAAGLGDEPITFDIQFIRPGDGACVAVLHLAPGKEAEWLSPPLAES
jgi:hypothetical protein